jgi:hypothetical protein
MFFSQAVDKAPSALAGLRELARRTRAVLSSLASSAFLVSGAF